jgi:Tol biopolymer transport system component
MLEETSMQINTTSKLLSRPTALPPAQKLTTLEGEPFAPTVTPDGQTVVFAAGTTQPLVREMYTVGIDGTDQSQLTDRRVNLSWQPSISPDGKKIAYVVEKQGKTDLQVMNLDGSGNVNLTDTNKGYWSPSWSADGKTIATTSRDTRGGNLEIVTVASDGTSKTQKTDLGYNADNPVFSPTGSHIVFGLAPGFGPAVLCSIRADGTNFMAYSTDLMLVGKPAVSDDGHILFSGTKGNGRFGIYEAKLESEDPAKLVVDSEFGLSPTLSPDDKRIAFVNTDDNGRFQIFEAARSDEESQITQVTQGEGSSTSPTYTPDGEGLVFISSRGGDSEIYLQSLKAQ